MRAQPLLINHSKIQMAVHWTTLGHRCAIELKANPATRRFRRWIRHQITVDRSHKKIRIPIFGSCKYTDFLTSFYLRHSLPLSRPCTSKTFQFHFFAIRRKPVKCVQVNCSCKIARCCILFIEFTQLYSIKQRLSHSTRSYVISCHCPVSAYLSACADNNNTLP